MKKQIIKPKGSFRALLPLGVFLMMYLVTSLSVGDFYKMPVSVAFLTSAVVALSMNKNKSMNEKINIFCKGAGETNIVLMCIIFILAGAFAQVAKDMGAVDSTVNLGLSILPSNILIAGVFLIGCFISLSIGTSMGTIVAIAPMAIGVAQKTGMPVGLALGAVVGGAMFGDNLSMISDTTIAATRTQGCEMKDKFKTNIIVAVPAAIITLIIFIMINKSGNVVSGGTYFYSLIKVVPYIIVLITALMGVNVMKVLVGGTILSGIIGIGTKSFDVWGFVNSVGKGISGMSELVIISLLIGGTVEIIKENGGIEFIINLIKSRINSKIGAKLGIALLVSIVDLCTANNTIAIVMAGPIAKEIGDEYGLEPKKVASILDTFSCFCQGLIPYGAQLLLAAGLAAVSPFSIIKFLFYPYLLGIITLVAILLNKL